EATRAAMIAALLGVEVEWGTWRMLSPLDHPEGCKDVKTPYPPEAELGKMGAGGPGPDLGATYDGKGGAKAGWREIESKPDIGGEGGMAPLNLAEGLKGDDGFDAVGYLYRPVTAKRACEVPIACGADDGMRLWLNGDLLIDDGRETPMDPSAHR